MSTYSEKTSSSGENDVGRPIIVYDDSAEEQRNQTLTASSGIVFSCL